jgi:hypothetical protein
LTVSDPSIRVVFVVEVNRARLSPVFVRLKVPVTVQTTSQEISVIAAPEITRYPFAAIVVPAGIVR